MSELMTIPAAQAGDPAYPGYLELLRRLAGITGRE
jgi:hypothetical protein